MADDDDKKQSHTLSDHVLGQDFVHEHDGDADHDHDHFEFDADGPLEENPIWIQDHVTLVTVGIDIGSSGTQVIFSRISLRRYGEDLTSRYYVVSRETLFQSPVALTPYSSDERIDESALGTIIDGAYAAAEVDGGEAGFYWNRGDVLSPSQLDRVAENMADLLIVALTQRPVPQVIEHLYLTDPIGELGHIDGLMFSGGVGEYVYGREDR